MQLTAVPPTVDISENNTMDYSSNSLAISARRGQWDSPSGGRRPAVATAWHAQLGLRDRLLLEIALWTMLGVVACGVLAIRYLPQLLALGAGLIAVVLVAGGPR